MRPTFLVIGAAKAGTTSLCHLLSQHPAIFFPSLNELHFFSFDELFARGPHLYEPWFDGATDAQQIGEGSTTYTVRRLFPRTAERIAAYRLDLKLIYIVREPLARMESVWLQLRHFTTASPFQRVGVAQTPEGMRVDVDFNSAVRRQSECIVESTNYLQELGEYRRHFADRQILVLLFEELVAAPRAVTRRCFEFLGVAADVELPDYSVHLNPTDGRRMPRGAIWRLWSSPKRRRIYDSIVKRLPRAVRESFSRILTTRTSERPAWDPATRAWALSRLEGDLATFLEQNGYPRDRWKRG